MPIHKVALKAISIGIDDLALQILTQAITQYNDPNKTINTEKSACQSCSVLELMTHRPVSDAVLPLTSEHIV